MARRGGNRLARKRLAAVLALAPHLVLIEVERAERVTRLPARQDDARLVPLPYLEQLPPRRVFPGAVAIEAIEADAHHRVAVAVDWHGSLVEQELERESVAHHVRKAGAVNFTP